MPAKVPSVYVMHIRDCWRQIIRYVAEGGPDWSSIPLYVDAICRNITIIGEAARQIDRPL